MLDANIESLVEIPEPVRELPNPFAPPEAFVPPPLPPPPVPPQPYVYEVRGLTQFKDGIIDCEVLHEIFGWIPFTANPDDKEPATLAVFKYIEDNDIDVSTLPPSPNLAISITEGERSWRNHELMIADVELLKAEDADPACVGTPTQWRQYRVDLRNWPQSQAFPDSTMRPVRPTA
jgi:hypothetical protein